MKVILVLAALAGAASATLVQAQAKPLVLYADSSRDGKVSLAEYQAHRRSLFMRMDANNDGRVDKAEWSKGADQVVAILKNDGIDGGGRFGKDSWWNKLDANKDGYITVAEVNAMTADRFKIFDTNLNGYIDGREPQLAKVAIEGGTVPP